MPQFELFNEYETLEHVTGPFIGTVEKVEDGIATILITDGTNGYLDEIHTSVENLPEEGQEINATYKVEHISDNTVSIKFSAEETKRVQNEVQEIMNRFEEVSISPDKIIEELGEDEN